MKYPNSRSPRAPITSSYCHAILTILVGSILVACPSARPISTQPLTTEPSPTPVDPSSHPSTHPVAFLHPPPTKPSSPILAAFDGLADSPGGILTWSSPQRLQRYRPLFDDVLDLSRRESHQVIPILIAALGAPELSIHQPAAYLLRHVTGNNLGHPSLGTPDQRSHAQADWDKWWSRTRVDKTFRPVTMAKNKSTVVVDEIPGRLVGNDDEPPGRLLHFRRDDTTVFETFALKMPYDVAITPEGHYLVNIIRARAVYQVSPTGKVVSEIKVGGYPCSIQLLDTGNVLVAGWDDDVPGFVREFDRNGNIVWRLEKLRWPWKAARLPNGHTLIADAGRNRVFEVNPDGGEVWAVGNLGPPKPELFDALGPVYVQRLDDGNTLVSIRGSSKVVEIEPDGTVVWSVGPEMLLNQYSAVRLWNGNTLIADGGHFRVIEVNVDKQIVWEKGGFGYPAKAYRW